MSGLSSRWATGSPRHNPPRPLSVRIPSQPQFGRRTSFTTIDSNTDRKMPLARKIFYGVMGTMALLVLITLVQSQGFYHKSQYVIPARGPVSHEKISQDLFQSTAGAAYGCPQQLTDIYVPYHASSDGKHPANHKACNRRTQLLESFSSGGRRGFDVPYFGHPCHYRWFSTAEMCMILSRFEHVIFIGDDLGLSVYKGFNILLRQNVALGALRQWNLKKSERDSCVCDNQFMRPECSMHAIRSSAELEGKDAQDVQSAPYICRDAAHSYIQITGASMSAESSLTLQKLLAPSGGYKPIPIIHTLSLSTTLSWPAATGSMDEVLAYLDNAATRGYPMLWLGPVAAGHLKPPSQIMSQGNNALWHYTVEMAKEARSRDFDVLNFYNLTMQATSWDGSAYGTNVAMVQAMMVMNWLARVDST